MGNVVQIKVYEHVHEYNKMAAGRRLIGDSIQGGGVYCRVRCRPQLNDQPVGQAGDGQPGIADEALFDTQLVGAVGRKDADAASTDFNLIYAAIVTFYRKDAISGFFV